MESFKQLDEVLKPDPRNEAFVKIDRETGQFVPMSIEDYHRALCGISLKESVPEDVQSYFETIKNVCLYGWFVYPFFTVSEFLSYTAIEMALRKRFDKDDPCKRWGLKRLLQEAKNQGLISDQGFPSIQELRERQAKYEARLDIELDSPFEQRVADYTLILIQTLPYLRNAFAHPTSQMILTPSYAISSLTVAAELINQLF